MQRQGLTNTRRKKKKEANMKGGDRLSDLLENAIHHIMSFLSPEESLRLSILSKRLSSAHLSSPSIYFFSSSWKFHEDLFLDSVRSSLKRRRTLDDNTFQKLCFDLYVFTDRRSPHWALKTLKSAAERLEDLANFALEKNIPDVFLTCHGDYETCRGWQDTNVTIRSTLPNVNVLLSLATNHSLELGWDQSGF